MVLYLASRTRLNLSGSSLGTYTGTRMMGMVSSQVMLLASYTNSWDSNQTLLNAAPTWLTIFPMLKYYLAFRRTFELL